MELPLFLEESEGGVAGGEELEFPPFQEDWEGDGCGGGDECDGGGFPEGGGGLVEDEPCEFEGEVDLEPPELGDGGGLDEPFEFEGELELEPWGGGALEPLG